MRPIKEIDWNLVDELLIAGCEGTEIAPHFDMHHDTFYNRVLDHHGMGFTAYRQQKRSVGHSHLRKKQYDKALTGDSTMLIWLGKNCLDQKDKDLSKEIDEIKANLSLLTGQLEKERAEYIAEQQASRSYAQADTSPNQEVPQNTQ